MPEKTYNWHRASLLSKYVFTLNRFKFSKPNLALKSISVCPYVFFPIIKFPLFCSHYPPAKKLLGLCLNVVSEDLKAYSCFRVILKGGCWSRQKYSVTPGYSLNKLNIFWHNCRKLNPLYQWQLFCTGQVKGKKNTLLPKLCCFETRLEGEGSSPRSIALLCADFC